MKKSILIVASGTGGHVVPAINVSEKLLNHKLQIIWIGTKNGIENKIVKRKDITIKHIKSSGIRGKNIIDTMRGLFNLVQSFFQSLVILHKEKPLFILGFGGYISVPVSFAGFVMRVPVYVHESNSIAGTANKLNNKISRNTFQTFPKTFPSSNKIILSGNPIKSSFDNIEKPEIKYAMKKNKIKILIFGGSQGSKFFNEVIPFCLSDDKDLFSVKHISGANNLEIVKNSYKKNNLSAEVIEFSNQMDEMYNWADIVISRSGSMTVTEISHSGRASILVPFLYATDNHQYHNAKYLVEKSAAILIEENKNFSKNLKSSLKHLYSNQKNLLKIAINAKNLFPNDSGDIIIKNIPELDEKLNNATS